MSLPFARPKSITDQVDNVLRNRIRNRVYPPGGRLPSESELSTEFGVSRTTVRTVLTRLATEGLLLRKHGDGTYVNLRLQGAKSNMEGLWEFGEIIEANGYAASIMQLAVYSRVATDDEVETLNLYIDEQVVVLERLFYANAYPVIWVSNTIPTRLLIEPGGSISGELSLRKILEKYCKVKIAYAISQVCSKSTSETIGKLLQRPAGEPLLNIQIVFYDSNNQAIVTGSSLLDDTRIPLRLVQAWN